MSHFKLISSTRASDVVPVSKYVSEKTGLTVIIANVEGPIVNGFFCLATEAHDDDGLPHTLEHLIFLGSQNYPYKGILDLLANRCMAQGTNAWTDTDHTCYTIYTAGDSGMLTLLPIYLDHILNPTLTDQGFLTEVHHVDGEGDDAGVVYCEMQGRENSADSRCDLRLLRAAYPNSGYSAETGGITKNLRESTNNTKGQTGWLKLTNFPLMEWADIYFLFTTYVNDNAILGYLRADLMIESEGGDRISAILEVRNFHKKFYRPENLTIILTGQIEADNVFKALEPVEEDIIAKRGNEVLEPWVKPWQTIPPMPCYGEYTEQWPADTEDCGQVQFGWRGPLLTEPSGARELTACAVILRYLCDTAAAPLQRCLVEREDALAGDVSYNLTENIAALIKIQLDNVPVDKLEIARDEATRCLKCVRDGNDVFNMDRMTRLLRKQLRECYAGLESDPHHAIAFRCIGDALYSQNEQDFISRLNPQQHLEELLKEGPKFWLELMQKYFTDGIITIVGSPSIALQDKMAEEERNRIEAQRKRLGPAGLKKKQEILEEAIQFNERAPPAGTLGAVPVPGCERLRCHRVASWSPDTEPCPHFDLSQLPIYARVHSLKSHFVYMNLIFDTTSAEQATRKWLPLHLNSLAECPVRRAGALVPHEDVVSATEQLTVVFNAHMGFGRPGNFSVGQFGNFVLVETRCEPADYEAVVNHLYEVLYAAEITKERLLVFAQRLINDVSQVRRSGHKMVYGILRDSLYSQDSNMHWSSVLRQQKFLKDLIEQLNAGGDSAEAALNEAKEAFKKMTENVWLHLATDFSRYPLSTEPWKRFPKKGEGKFVTPSRYWDAELLVGEEGGGSVTGVGGLESSFLAALSPGPTGFAPDDVAPLLVALNYFTQLEGPMWRLIRGSGLSYGYGASAAPAEGRVVFSLYRATNAVAAYTKAKAIVEEYLAADEFDEDLFESAKSTALFEVVENEKCTADVVSQSLINFFKQVGDDYNRELVCAVAGVSAAAARRAARAWLPAMFDARRATTSVVCHPSKVRDLQAAFHKIDVKLKAYESMEASPFNI